MWEHKYMDEFEEYKKFKEKFDLEITEYHWETTISQVYTNTLITR
ncbi:MAG: hypothetical protein U9Q66_03690 [Patescibacteria group bacterium]|nr:hypothetical protein [Patescibacteria group bacterium]